MKKINLIINSYVGLTLELLKSRGILALILTESVVHTRYKAPRSACSDHFDVWSIL